MKLPRLGISSDKMSLLLPSCLRTFTQLLGGVSSSSFNCAPAFAFDCSSSLQMDHCSGLLELLIVDIVKWLYEIYFSPT